jgi:cellobiose phosphorylase
VDPCLPERFTQVRVKRLFRGVVYTIAITRAGKPGLVVDGKSVAGNIIPPVAGKTAVSVEVRI